MSLPEVFVARVEEDQDIERVDRWVAAQMKHVARASVKRWIEAGRVQVNGRVCRPKDKVRPGDEVRVDPDLPPATLALPDASVSLDVIYEDEYLVVVNKPAGLVVHPGRGHQTGTLVNGLLARPGFERPPLDPLDEQGAFRPGIVHRIDKDTSGLLVVAKEQRTREGLKEQLANHTVTRRYQAITVGIPRVTRVATLHGRDPKNRLRFSSRVDRGKPAVTHVRVLDQLASGRAAFVECQLETGRTHQIRVHLSIDCNTPLLGDELYGGLRGDASVTEVGRALGRQALHAGVLGFVHPRTGANLSFEAPFPDDMNEALLRLRSL